MEPNTGIATQPSDLFIVLEPFRSGFADFVRALEPLASTPGEPMLGSSDVYYRADTDIALLTIRLEREALTPQKLAWLTSVAARADLPVLDPSRLGYSDRRAFYEDYLPNYRVRVEARGGPQEALEELARLLALPDAPPVRPPAQPTGPPFRPGQMDEMEGEDSSRRTGAQAAAGTEPHGRYGAARTVGQGASARSLSRHGSGTHPKQGPGGTASPPARDSSGTGSHGRQKTVDYSGQAAGAPRRRAGPAPTPSHGPRVHAPDEGAILPVASTPSARITARGAAVYPLAREAQGVTRHETVSRSGGDLSGREAAGATSPPAGAGAPAPAPSRVIVPVPLPARTGAASATMAAGRSSASMPAVAASMPAASMSLGMPSTDSDMVPDDAPTGPTSPSASAPFAAASASTVAGASASASRERISSPRAAAAPGRSDSGSHPPTDPVPAGKRPALIVDDEESPLMVRFLRGDMWAPGRLRALSMQGARLAAAAPPRLGDRVYMSLSLDHLDVQVSAEVTQVTTAAQAAGTGEPSGFAVHFMPLEAALRTKLVNLLKRAKQSGIALKPPPPRASVRFPVRWPAGVITSWGELSTAALDVSRSGLFLASGTVIGAREIIFHLPMDTTGRALSGRAEIAREVTEEMAQQRGLSRGYGVRILDFTRNDAERYDAFLDRIRMRTEKRVMVAARRERASELGRGLIAAGYAVHAGNDLLALAESMNEAGPPPDAAIIESALLATEPNAAALKRALHAKHVPCLTLGDEQPERARAVVDHLLHIA